MVFLGHGALIGSGIAAMASFAHPERRPETTFLRRWLTGQGFLLWDTPREVGFEGEGDAAFSHGGTRLWAAHGVRTCRSSHAHVAEAWGVPVHSLQLVDPRFYHLDTCFAPLAGGSLLYYPGAFDAESREAIEAVFPQEKRVMVSEADATRMACCALNLGRLIFTGEISSTLAGELFDRGFDVMQLELGEFIKGGARARWRCASATRCRTKAQAESLAVGDRDIAVADQGRHQSCRFTRIIADKRLDLDLGDTKQTKLLRRRVGKVENAAGHDRSTIVDTNKGAAMVYQVGNTQPGAEREAAMRAGESIHIEALAIRGFATLKLLAVPGSAAYLKPAVILRGSVGLALCRGTSDDRSGGAQDASQHTKARTAPGLACLPEPILHAGSQHDLIVPV